MHIVDIGRSSKSSEQILSYFKTIKANLKQKDGSFKYTPIQISGGLEFTKEYPEMALMFVDQIVKHKAKPNSRTSEIFVMPKVWMHPKLTEYNIDTLRKSIETLIASLCSSKKLAA